MATAKAKVQSPILQRIDTETRLSSRALLVDLDIGGWNARVADDEVSDEVRKNHDAEDDAGTFMKQLVSKTVINKLRKISSRIQLEHRRLTLPWFDGGSRICASTRYMKYCERMRARKAEWDAAVEEFLTVDYPAAKTASVKRLGTMHKEHEYPSVDELRTRLYIRWTANPVPDSDDFRAGGLTPEQIDEIRAEIDKQSDARLKAGTTAIWVRIKKLITNTLYRLKRFQKDADGKTLNTFRDTITSNIEELLDLIPILNDIVEDDDITRVAADIRQSLLMYSAEDLRENEVARADTILEAERIAKLMSQFI